MIWLHWLFFRPSHTSLKSREKGQGNVEDLSKRDFRRELEEREHEAQREKDDKRRQVSTTSKIVLQYVFKQFSL